MINRDRDLDTQLTFTPRCDRTHMHFPDDCSITFDLLDQYQRDAVVLQCVSKGPMNAVRDLGVVRCDSF